MRDKPFMSWLRDFVHSPQTPDYARRVLDRYRLGMRAGGAIRGVRILAASDSCPACQALAGAVYHPDEAPLIPIAGCTHPQGCRCVYRPVMEYDQKGDHDL